MSRWQAWQIVGGLSRPSKMPCFAWGIPAETCRVGSQIANVSNSVCHSCYALKGFFRTPKVKQAYQRRLDASSNPEWVTAMIKLVYWQAAETGEPYFRWFDSGDLQSVEMLQQIATVAKHTPEIRHWLPTREYRIVTTFLAQDAFPPNLTVRVSAHLVDASPPKLSELPTSTVHSCSADPVGHVCPAPEQKPANCGGCRSCWDVEVENVSYPLH